MKVSKDYFCDGVFLGQVETIVETIEGVFNGTEEEWAGCTSHSDPRITWEEEPEEGWVYKDFSFRRIAYVVDDLFCGANGREELEAMGETIEEGDY
jgi:hypothetical protein